MGTTEMILVALGVILLLGLGLLAGRHLAVRGSAVSESSLHLMQQQVEGLRGQLQESLRVVSSELSTQVNHLKESVSQRLAENVQVAQSSGQQVGEGIHRALDAVGDVRQQLGRLEEASHRIFDVGKNISTLQELLQAPQFRGGFGEFLLEDLLARLFPKAFYATQFTFASGERVDAVLTVGPGRIPIDSKFPMESFRRAAEAARESPETEARQALRRFRADIRKHIDEMARKYVHPKENIYDFALMYIPAENVYYETIVRDENWGEEGSLFEYAASRRVIPVSPNTLYAYFQVILIGLRGLQVEQSARKILAGLGHLQKELEKMGESFDKAGSQLQHARNNYEEARQRLADFSRQLALLSELPGSNDPAVMVASSINESQD